MESNADSRQLRWFQKEFSKWYPLNEQGIRNAPDQQGTYVIRKAGGKCFGRLRGESDILYIGKTEGKDGLKQRLREYLHPGRTQWTNLRIYEMAKRYQMEIAWCPCNEPGNLEHQLLQRYVLEHDELPPLNHTRPRLLKKLLVEGFHLTDLPVAASKQ